MSENGGRHKTLYLLQGGGGLYPFSGWGDEGRINATFVPVHRGKKRTYSYGYSRSLALRSLLAPRSRPVKSRWRRTVVARAKLRKKSHTLKFCTRFFQKRDIRTGIVTGLFQSPPRIIGTSMNVGQKDFRIFARVPAHVAEYCKK